VHFIESKGRSGKYMSEGKLNKEEKKAEKAKKREAKKAKKMKEEQQTQVQEAPKENGCKKS
jgi:hypothetical protein